MLRKQAVSTLSILIACIAAFTLGLGTGLWEKVEIVNVIIYTVFWITILIGLIWFGAECLLLLRTYRQTTGKRFDNASKITRLPRVEVPALPDIEFIDIDLETRKNVDRLFNKAGS